MLHDVCEECKTNAPEIFTADGVIVCDECYTKKFGHSAFVPSPTDN